MRLAIPEKCFLEPVTYEMKSLFCQQFFLSPIDKLVIIQAGILIVLLFFYTVFIGYKGTK